MSTLSAHVKMESLGLSLVSAILKLKELLWEVYSEQSTFCYTFYVLCFIRGGNNTSE